MASLNDIPLAFSSDPHLTHATKRISFTTTDQVLLNVELFDPTSYNSEVDITYHHSNPILLHIHGVCESIETSAVQSIVTEASEWNVKVAVVELEGHGLSSGSRCVCTDFDRLVNHVVEFVKHTVTTLSSFDETASSQLSSGRTTKSNIRYVISGDSLGGVLAIYAAHLISQLQLVGDGFPGTLIGVAPIAPVVGIRPDAVPPKPILEVLKCLSFIAPSLRVPFTPYEDPTEYNCPKDTKRNFRGYWPLGTSKMLLDVPSLKVKQDITMMNEKNVDKTNSSSDQSHYVHLLSKVNAMLLFCAEKDEFIPLESMYLFYESVVGDDRKNKGIVVIPSVGHELLHNKSSCLIVTKKLFEWMLNIG